MILDIYYSIELVYFSCRSRRKKMDSFCSEQVDKLARALIKVQEQLQPAIKDANNPFIKSKHATLSSII